MEIRSSDQAKENIESFAKRYINLMLEKKKIDQDVKCLKDEFKEEGVPVGVVVSMLNKIKSAKKKSDTEKFEEETILEWLESNREIDDEIGILISK